MVIEFYFEKGRLEGAKYAFVFEQEGQRRGGATLGLGRPDGDTLCVVGIYVDEPWRGQGIGRIFSCFMTRGSLSGRR
jgi:GNAT superfamily N-acetyltransferase